MTDGLPPGGGNNPHLDREIEAGKRSDAAARFEAGPETKKARIIESVVHGDYSQIPSLQRLAYNALPDNQRLPRIMHRSIDNAPWGCAHGDHRQSKHNPVGAPTTMSAN